MRDWPSHELITHVAAILLHEELRYDVEILTPQDLPEGAEVTAGDYRLAALATIDANFEVWHTPEKQEEYERWVVQDADGEEHALELGVHFAPSSNGVYVPRYVTEEDPRLGFYTMLQDADNLHTFSQVSFPKGDPSAGSACLHSDWGNCSTDYIWRPPNCREPNAFGGPARTPSAGPAHTPSGGQASCTAQLIRGPSTHSSGLFEQQIVNNNLNVSALYVPSSKLKDIVWSSYAQRLPFMFVSWEPREPLLGLPTQFFEMMRFPPNTDNCPTAGTTPEGPGRCASNVQQLLKIVSQRLHSSADARNFASQFALTTEDYDALFLEHAATQQDSRKAACQWIQRNIDRVQARADLLNYTKKVDYPLVIEWKAPWIAVFGQFAFAVFLELAFDCIDWKGWKRRCCRRDAKPKKSDSDAQGLPALKTAIAKRGSMRKSGEFGSMFENTTKKESKLVTWLNSAQKTIFVALGVETKTQEFYSVMRQHRMSFFSTQRAEVDFISSEGRFNAFSDHGHEMFRMSAETNVTMELMWYVIQTPMKRSLLFSVQFSFSVGALSSLVNILNSNALLNGEEEYGASFATPMERVLNNFTVLPALLIVFKVMSNMRRWTRWLGYSGSVYGRLADLGLIIGALSDACTSEDVRKVQYRFFRYLNVVHVLTYSGLDMRIPKNHETLCTKLARAGLLTSQEVPRLVPAVQMHAMVLQWISILWHEEIESMECDGDNHPNAQNFMEKLMGLRAAIASVRSASEFERQPDVTNGMLYVVMYMMLFFVIFSYPITCYTAWTGYLQPFAILSAFGCSLTYHGLLQMQRILDKSPFDVEGDCVNIDYLLCDFEAASFSMIRASYASADVVEGGEDFWKLKSRNQLSGRIPEKPSNLHKPGCGNRASSPSVGSCKSNSEADHDDGHDPSPPAHYKPEPPPPVSSAVMPIVPTPGAIHDFD